MRRALILVAALLTGSTIGAQQPTQYLISGRILAGSPADSASMKLIASPTLRVRAGEGATLNLGDDTSGFKIVVTPTELALGRIALHVFTETRIGAKVQGSTFDVLSGPGVTAPTVVPRDAIGGFLVDERGYPHFVELSAIGIVR